MRLGEIVGEIVKVRGLNASDVMYLVMGYNVFFDENDAEDCISSYAVLREGRFEGIYLNGRSLRSLVEQGARAELKELRRSVKGVR